MWRDAYNTGIEPIDRQHRQFVRLIEELEVAIQSRLDTKILSVIDEFSNYASKHFRQEERLMCDNDYPDCDRHMSLHSDYVDKINSFRNRRHEFGSNLKTLIYLREWFIDHICTEDSKYAAFLKEKGVTCHLLDEPQRQN